MVRRHRRQKTQAAICMRLLLVEDSPRLTELINETMHDAGWRLDGVSTLRDAEAAIAAREHDLVLLDLGLPDGDGLQLLQWIRREHVGLPVLIITARGSVDERIAGLDAGADDYLVKPFHHRELLSRCRAMLRRNPKLYSRSSRPAPCAMILQRRSLPARAPFCLFLRASAL